MAGGEREGGGEEVSGGKGGREREKGEKELFPRERGKNPRKKLGEKKKTNQTLSLRTWWCPWNAAICPPTIGVLPSP